MRAQKVIMEELVTRHLSFQSTCSKLGHRPLQSPSPSPYGAGHGVALMKGNLEIKDPRSRRM